MKKLLIVVDYQNDFVDGALGFKGAELLDSIIEAKIKSYLDLGHDLIYTLDTHHDNYLETQEGKRLPIPHVIDGTFGHEIYGKTKNYVEKALKVFKKNTFGSIELGNFLKDKDYQEIELVGLVTNMCVVSNAIIAKAALPDARIVVDKNACDSFDKDLHSKTIEVLAGMQVDII